MVEMGGALRPKGRAMKRIVVLCDGTWNETDDATPTNVVRLAQALAPRDADGVEQIPVYIDGVGTGEGITWISRFWSSTNPWPISMPRPSAAFRI